MEKATAYFELAVSLHLWRWQALTLAVENEWGGADSADKRDWLAGTLADLYTAAAPGKEVDVEDVEDVVVQVMGDEFSVMLEDDSAYELATAIHTSWRECQEGNFEQIEAMKRQFEARPAAVAAAAKKQKDDDDDDDDDSSDSGTDGEVDDEEEEEDAMEVDGQQQQQQQSVGRTTKTEPVVDDDGFELVQRRK